MPSPALPFVIDTTKDWVHCTGDSLVQWMGNTPPQGLFCPLMFKIWAQQAANAAPAGGYRASSGQTYAQPSIFMPITQNGKSGTGINDLYTNRIIRTINPLLAGGVGRTGRPKLIHYCSINDGGGMTLGAWNSLGGSAYFDAVQAAVPNVDILMLSVLFTSTEAWDTGTGGWTSSDDPITVSNTFYQSFAASRGFWFYDWRGTNINQLNTALHLESTMNPTGTLTRGVLTQDGTHPPEYRHEKLLIDCLIPQLDIRY